MAIPTPPATYRALENSVVVDATVESTVLVPPTYKSRPMPAPPGTCNAPVIVELAFTEAAIIILPVLLTRNLSVVPAATITVPVMPAVPLTLPIIVLLVPVVILFPAL